MHVHTCVYTHTRTHACTARHPPSQHAVYEWSSNGQVVIRCNKGTTSAYLAGSVVLCVSVRVCVCEFPQHLPRALIHRCTYWSIHNSQEAA